MSYEEDERNRRQLREIEDLRQAMRSRYIPIAWIKKWENQYCDHDQENMIRCLLRSWEKENETD